MEDNTTTTATVSEKIEAIKTNKKRVQTKRDQERALEELKALELADPNSENWKEVRIDKERHLCFVPAVSMKDKYIVLQEWCEDHCEGGFRINENNQFTFELATDALAYRLAWCHRAFNTDTGAEVNGAKGDWV